MLKYGVRLEFSPCSCSGILTRFPFDSEMKRLGTGLSTCDSKTVSTYFQLRLLSKSMMLYIEGSQDFDKLCSCFGIRFLAGHYEINAHTIYCNISSIIFR